MKKIFILIFVCAGLLVNAQVKDQLIPVNFSNVTITDNFWKPKIDKVATKTLEACIYQTEISNTTYPEF